MHTTLCSAAHGDVILLPTGRYWCASGCVVECQICNQAAAGSNLGLGYFTPRSTQPSIPPGSVNEYQLRLGRQRQVWLIQIADERVGVQVKLWDPLRTRAIPERFHGGDSLRRGAISSVCTFTFTLLHYGNWVLRIACLVEWNSLPSDTQTLYNSSRLIHFCNRTTLRCCCIQTDQLHSSSISWLMPL